MTETPPRAWGRHQRHRREPENRRNTPTGVGKTHRDGHQSRAKRKHPHGRGEDPTTRPCTNCARETPPRAWGRLPKSGGGGAMRRNTPTGVGKTAGCERADLRGQKHPHGRGEDRPGRRPVSLRSETPPRAWGRRVSGVCAESELRNTPTGVGKTRQVTKHLAAIRKHPHGRGEDRIGLMF